MERKVTTEVMTIGAKDAERFLLKNRNHQPGVKGTNRKSSPTEEAKWAADMAAGRWLLTHQGIAFDDEGYLTDGQTRCRALIIADRRKPGVTIDVMVTYGLEPESFKVMDTGRRRKLSDVLSTAGYTHVNMLAASAKLHYSYYRVPYKTLSSWTGSIPEWNGHVINDWVDSHPMLTAGIERIAASSLFRSIGNQAALVTGYALAREIRPDVDVEPFISDLAEGLGLTRYSAAWMLREKLRKRQNALKTSFRSNHSVERVEQLALFCKAFNHYADGIELKTLHWDSGGDKSFPLLRGVMLTETVKGRKKNA